LGAVPATYLSRAHAAAALGLLRVVARRSFRPRGPGYDARAMLAQPLRVLCGGADGIAIALAWHAGAVEVTVLARGVCDAEASAAAFEAARAIAAVDDDPVEFLAMIRSHPVVGALARTSDPRLPRTPTLFEAFAFFVLGQLVTSWEARESYKKLGWVAGEPIAGTRLRSPPTPAGVRATPMWKLHAIGIGSRRATTLRAGALRGTALERLRELAPEVAVGKLESLRGVGPWTANHVARTALGWSDAVPVGDLHAKTFVTEALTGEPGDDEAMLAALEPFRPHRARVVTLLERASGRRRDEETPPRRRARVDRHRREPWRY
jgi:3-methyladenine DNA glycosylase/8-oxoguanine DNA glycosylase